MASGINPRALSKSERTQFGGRGNEYIAVRWAAAGWRGGGISWRAHTAAGFPPQPRARADRRSSRPHWTRRGSRTPLPRRWAGLALPHSACSCFGSTTSCSSVVLPPGAPPACWAMPEKLRAARRNKILVQWQEDTTKVLTLQQCLGERQRPIRASSPARASGAAWQQRAAAMRPAVALAWPLEPRMTPVALAGASAWCSRLWGARPRDAATASRRHSHAHKYLQGWLAGRSRAWVLRPAPLPCPALALQTRMQTPAGPSCWRRPSATCRPTPTSTLVC